MLHILRQLNPNMWNLDKSFSFQIFKRNLAFLLPHFHLIYLPHTLVNKCPYSINFLLKLLMQLLHFIDLIIDTKRYDSIDIIHLFAHHLQITNIFTSLLLFHHDLRAHFS